MSVVGIDFGNSTSVIAVARNRGIDVICNEVSGRLTSSMVSFGLKSRSIGESAKTLEISNFKNTLGNIKRLLGRKYSDPLIAREELPFLNYDIVPDEHDNICVRINLGSEVKTYTIVQIIGMLFNKFKAITSAESGGAHVSDVVISVPAYYNDEQRRNIIDAAGIAGLNVLRLVNETTAAALTYGIPRTDLPESGKPKMVCFIDIGHSNYVVSIVAFLKGRLEVKSVAYDEHYGGRNFDETLCQTYIDEFSKKYHIDLSSNKKAGYRLRGACERTKRILSANSKTILSVENLMNDKDVMTEITRSTFEELCAHLLSPDRLYPPIQRALEQSKMTKEDIDVIELVGGTTRIPAIREVLRQFFGKELSSTLNPDEAIARGAAFVCAMNSPSCKVKEFQFLDTLSKGITLYYEASPEDPSDTQVEVFPALNVVPCTKLITFNKREDFEVVAAYTDPSFNGEQQVIGTYKVMGSVPKNNGEASMIKVKTKIDHSGIFSLNSAQLIQEDVVLDQAPNDTAAGAGEDAVVDSSEKKKKIVTKKIDLEVIGKNTSLDKKKLLEYRELEMSLENHDKLVFDTEERRNALEEYIYDMRARVENGDLSPYMKDEDKKVFLSELKKTEDWLYSAEEGSESTKSVYIAKLEDLQKLGHPAVKLLKETMSKAAAEAEAAASKLKSESDASTPLPSSTSEHEPKPSMQSTEKPKEKDDSTTASSLEMELD